MIHIDWNNPPDLTAEHANIPELLETVKTLSQCVREYEDWIGRHGYSDVYTVERMLDSIQRRTRNVLDWASDCEEWKRRVTTLDPAVDGMAGTLKRACVGIRETVGKVNDPSIEREYDPSSVFVASGTEPAHIPAVAVAQLEMAANTLREWLPQIAAGPNSPAAGPEQSEGGNGKSKQPAKRSKGGRLTENVTGGASDTIAALLRVFTNGVSDDRTRRAAAVLNGPGTVDEKLTRIDGLIPFPPTASGQTLGDLFGVSATAVKNTGWWTRNRKGKKNAEIERRYAEHQKRAQQHEPDPQD